MLVRISATETSAQLQEAEANAAQIEARLGLSADQAFDPHRVPDVMNAKASLDLAEAEFGRIKSLLDQKVVSQSEYDQRRAQVDVARQQFQVAQNVAEQSYRSLQAARARIDLARKASGRHDDSGAVLRACRRTAGQRRRLRDPRRPRRDGRAGRSDARRVDGSGTGGFADQAPARPCRFRSTRIPARCSRREFDSCRLRCGRISVR